MTEFYIFMSDENGFKINIENNVIFSIKYSLFEVDDDILCIFKDDNEHNIFLRKDKLKKLSEYR
jgi:hypothetical protein